MDFGKALREEMHEDEEEKEVEQMDEDIKKDETNVVRSNYYSITYANEEMSPNSQHEKESQPRIGYQGQLSRIEKFDSF